MDPIQHYLAQHRALIDSDSNPAWLVTLRRKAIEKFESLGFPTRRRSESWKYTNVAPLTKIPFELPPADRRIEAKTVQSLVGGLFPDNRLVFVNSRFDESLSTVPKPANGLVVKPLSALLDEPSELLESMWGRFVETESNPFALLNTAFASDGLFIRVPRNIAVKGPLHLVYVGGSDGSPTLCHPRTVVLCEPGSELTLIETYVGQTEAPYFTNSVCELVVEANATLNHVKLQQEHPAAFHISTTNVRINGDAVYKNHLFNLGGKLVRNNILAVLNGRNAEATLNGLTMARAAQHIDNQTVLEHQYPDGRSWQTYKGVLTDRATSVFNGKIFVQKDAQKTDAKQQNNNLLLSDEAVINTKPQLEIFADDVKCTHGATVGRMDPESLFYLRARGIDESQARNILTQAFASEVVDGAAIEELSAQLNNRLRGWLDER